MQFSIDDKVVHPMHGPGRITSVRHQELVKGFKHYYVVETLGNKELTVFVPVRTVDEIGMRPVMGRDELTRVWDTLGSVPQELPDDYRERQGAIREKLRTGYPVKIAEVLRDLTWHRGLDHLTEADLRLLDRGRELLAGEVALVIATEVGQANDAIDAALAGATESEAREEEEETEQVADTAKSADAQAWKGPLDALRRHVYR